MCNVEIHQEPKPRKCNYCQNHLNPGDPPVPLAGHGHCSYNDDKHFEECTLCLKNSGNTIRAQDYRDKKRGKSVSKQFKIIKNVMLKPFKPKTKISIKNIEYAIAECIDKSGKIGKKKFV